MISCIHANTEHRTTHQIHNVFHLPTNIASLKHLSEFLNVHLWFPDLKTIWGAFCCLIHQFKVKSCESLWLPHMHRMCCKERGTQRRPFQPQATEQQPGHGQSRMSWQHATSPRKFGMATYHLIRWKITCELFQIPNGTTELYGVGFIFPSDNNSNELAACKAALKVRKG